MKTIQWPWLLVIAAQLTNTEPLSRSEAQQSVWFVPLAGIPIANSTFFHSPDNSSTKLAYTLSQDGILAAIAPRDGRILWRAETSSHTAKPAGSLIVTHGNSIIQSFDAVSGFLQYETLLNDAIVDIGLIPNLKHTMLYDVILASTGNTVRCLDGVTGDTKWESRVGHGHLLKVTYSGAKVYAITALEESNTLKLHSTVIDAETGHVYETVAVDAFVDRAEKIKIIESQTSATMVWYEQGTLKANVLGSRKVQMILHKADPGFEVHSPPVQRAMTGFVVTDTVGSAWTFSVATNGNVDLVREIRPDFENAVFRALEHNGKAYFARSSSISIDVFDEQGNAVIASQHDLLQLSHFSADITIRSDGHPVVRTFYVAQSGQIGVIHGAKVQWSREEGLSSPNGVVYVDLQASQASQALKGLESGFICRVRRHLTQLSHLTTRISTFISDKSTPNRTSRVPYATADSFGFQKYIIFLSSSGKVFALDSLEGGQIVWSFYDRGIGGNAQIHKMGRHTIAVMGRSKLFCFDAWSGTLFSETDVEEYDTVIGVFKDALLVKHEGSVKAYTCGDEHSLWNQEALYFFLKNDLAIEGYIIDANSAKVRQSWSIAPQGKIKAVATGDAHDTIASIGKILGDRSVLYKYLNAHVAAVASVEDSGLMHVSVFDSVSGRLLYETTVSNVDPHAEVQVGVSDNGICCAYKSNSAARGWHLLVLEMYESEHRNVHISEANTSSFEETLLPHVKLQTFILSSGVYALGSTKTRFGIASKDIVLATHSNQLYTIPRRILDPRRPIGRDTTKEEKEEGLVPYQPLIPDDRQLSLNREHYPLKIRRILTVPVTLESTSLVLAYGHDILLARTAPSGSFDVLGTHFNKAQLVLTIAVLAAATAIISPIVRKRQLKKRWDS